MYYNKDAAAEGGRRGPPQTWDELEADAKKVKAAGGDSYGFGAPGQGDRDRRLLVLRAVGRGRRAAEGRQERHRADAGVKAATMYKRFIDEGLTEPDSTGYNRQDIERLFKQGKMATILSGPWLRGQIARRSRRTRLRASPASRRGRPRRPTASPTA